LVFYNYLDTYDDVAIKEKEIFISASASESECDGGYRRLKKQKTCSNNNTQDESDSSKLLLNHKIYYINDKYELIKQLILIITIDINKISCSCY